MRQQGVHFHKLHINFGERLEGIDRLPIETEIRRADPTGVQSLVILGQDGSYPIPAVVAQGTEEFVAGALADAVMAWDTGRGRTGNLMFWVPDRIDL